MKYERSTTSDWKYFNKDDEIGVFGKKSVIFGQNPCFTIKLNISLKGKNWEYILWLMFLYISYITILCF